MDIINSVADVPGVTFGLHICKGNYESKWIASGGYEYTADKVFALPVSSTDDDNGA